MRALSQKPPRVPRLRSLSEALRRVRALSPADPSSQVPSAPGPRPTPPPLLAPSPPVPFLSSRNGAGAARGRAPGTRLALGLALSATAPLAPPRALAQSVAPKAPLSSGGGGSCFRFLVSLQSGVASSTQPPLPLPNGAAAAEGCGGGGGGGNWRRRRPPLLPPRLFLILKI
ncbi:zinc-finger homeodomain protein 9-like [Hyaena hyaena]|uniref:zinc-finger homeodomain protein 9-like n=1 Tax=Hyaena hyaena TaxID=95912 RepID=UPI001923C022|nr:zinc-finger homeodomain protein 9-like [Hyaena hyaena]